MCGVFTQPPDGEVFLWFTRLCSAMQNFGEARKGVKYMTETERPYTAREKRKLFFRNWGKEHTPTKRKETLVFERELDNNTVEIASSKDGGYHFDIHTVYSVGNESCG